jgi:peptidoglycan/LPS O-acetylase OafA/YrhL
VEEHFYLSLAALMTFATAKRWRVSSLLIGCVVAALGVEVLRGLLILTHRPFYFYTHSRIDALLMGVVLAILSQFYPERFAWMQRQWSVLCLIIVAALIALYLDTDAIPAPQSMTSPFLVTLVDYGCFSLLLLLYRPDRKHWRPYRAIARMGVFSYGIYLWHVSVERPVSLVVHWIPLAFVPVVSTFLPYVLAIVLGVLSTKLIELPLLRLRERVVPATIPEPPVAAG